MYTRTALYKTLILLLVGFVCCTCSQDPLPKPSQTGQNTFGCLINGNAYIPDGGPAFSGIKPIYGGFFGIQSTTYKIGIYIYTYAKDKQQVDLYLNNFNLGKHLLKFDTGIKPASLVPRDYGLYRNSTGDIYVTTVRYTGWINLIKADTSTGVVAGTFEFTAASPGGQTVRVTNGRFDVNARTQ